MRFLRILFWGGLAAAATLFFFNRREQQKRDAGKEAHVDVKIRDMINWEELRGFDAIDLRGGYHVMYHYADESRVEAEGSRDAKARLHATVESGRLKIAHRNGYQKMDDNLTIHLYAPTLREIDIRGAVDMKGSEPLQGERITLDVSGAGKIKLDVKAETLKAEISGAGKYILSGEADNANFNIAGAGDVRAFDLLTQELSIKVAGAGNAQVHVTEELNVTLLGAGKVVYDGDPQRINPKILGAGQLSRRQEQ